MSCLNKDITSLRAMAALVKKKGEIATVIKQYALDGLHIATESSLCAMAVLAKKNGEIATAIEQYALDGLYIATESLGCKY